MSTPENHGNTADGHRGPFPPADPAIDAQQAQAQGQGQGAWGEPPQPGAWPNVPPGRAPAPGQGQPGQGQPGQGYTYDPAYGPPYGPAYGAAQGNPQGGVHGAAHGYAQGQPHAAEPSYGAGPTAPATGQPFAPGGPFAAAPPPAGHAAPAHSIAPSTPAPADPGPGLRQEQERGATSAGPGAHRTGSPIIPPGLQPAGVTAGLCLLLGLLAPLSRPALAVAVVLLQAITAAGWFRLNGMWPARQGIALAFAAGLGSGAVLLALDGEYATSTGVGTLGIWCLLVLVLQLRHRGAADERLYALTVTVSATVATVLASGFLAAWGVTRPQADGPGWSAGAPVVVGVAAVAVTVVVRALPLPPLVSVAAALALGAGSGVASGGITGVGPSAALLAAGAACCALVGLRVASYDWPSRFVHFTAGVALPITAAAPAVYVLGRVLAG